MRGDPGDLDHVHHECAKPITLVLHITEEHRSSTGRDGVGWPDALKWNGGEEGRGGPESELDTDPPSFPLAGSTPVPAAITHFRLATAPPGSSLYRQVLSPHCTPGAGNVHYLINVSSTLARYVLLYLFYR